MATTITTTVMRVTIISSVVGRRVAGVLRGDTTVWWRLLLDIYGECDDSDQSHADVVNQYNNTMNTRYQ